MKKFLALFALLSVALAMQLNEPEGEQHKFLFLERHIGPSTRRPVDKAIRRLLIGRDRQQGQTVKWEQQGITWTLPPNWKKTTCGVNAELRGGGHASVG